MNNSYPRSTVRTVGLNGILLQGRTFWAPPLKRWIGLQVTVWYDEDDLSRIRACHGLCSAVCVPRDDDDTPQLAVA